jgi:hypothetical protein
MGTLRKVWSALAPLVALGAGIAVVVVLERRGSRT